MTPTEKLVNYMEEGFTKAPNHQYNLIDTSDGYVKLVDEINRIVVMVSPHFIFVSKYKVEDSSLLHRTEVPWDSFTKDQKERILKLVEPAIDIEPDIVETLEDIFKGIV